MRTARPPTAQAGGGNREAAGGRFGAREADDQCKTAAERPGVQPGRPPTAPRRTAEAETRPSGATHKRRGPAPHLAKPGVQPGAESDGASGGLGVPRALPLARGMSKPVASGENACTRDDGSGGPSPARSGGTTDHAAERNAGSGQAGSVTERSDGASPCWTRTAWSGAGPRSSRRDSFAGAAAAGTASPTTPGPGERVLSRDRDSFARAVPAG